MKTWDDYKSHVKSLSEKERRNMENIEELAECQGRVQFDPFGRLKVTQ